MRWVLWVKWRDAEEWAKEARRLASGESGLRVSLTARRRVHVT